MRRVVVTGMGIVSSLGTNQKEVAQSLRESRSGIAFSEEARDKGLRSHVAGKNAHDASAAAESSPGSFAPD